MTGDRQNTAQVGADVESRTAIACPADTYFDLFLSTVGVVVGPAIASLAEDIFAFTAENFQSGGLTWRAGPQTQRRVDVPIQITDALLNLLPHGVANAANLYKLPSSGRPRGLQNHKTWLRQCSCGGFLLAPRRFR